MVIQIHTTVDMENINGIKNKNKYIGEGIYPAHRRDGNNLRSSTKGAVSYDRYNHKYKL